MHPIEKVHKQILAGNVLGPSGTWISRPEALKRKRLVLKHVLDGEVEIDGKWIKLSAVDSGLKNASETAQKKAVSAVEPPIILKGQYSGSSKPLPTPSSASFPGLELRNAQEVKKDSSTGGGSVVIASDTQVLPAETNSDDLESGVLRDKQTITIRSMSLGKETVLTISESRAGTALVAVCSVQGFLDQTNADDFHEQLISMLDFGVRYFVIDFEKTNLIGSAGWGVLAVAARLIKASEGKLLICSMSSDIEESFLLLQFNEVIDSRSTISDCLETIDQIIKERKDVSVESGGGNATFSHYGESFEDLPIHEKIKSIISRNGSIGFFQIAKQLRQQQYGKVRINPFRLYLILKELNLESRLKRSRFYRSC